MSAVTSIEYVDLLESPHGFGGRWAQRGDPLDCWGIVVEVRLRLGLKTPDPFRAASSEDALELSAAVLEEFAEGWERVLAPTVPGDVAVFHGFSGHHTHAAVYLGGPLMLHAGAKFGVQAQKWESLRRHAKAIYRLVEDA